jgi:hypothetical protein
MLARTHTGTEGFSKRYMQIANQPEDLPFGPSDMLFINATYQPGQDARKLEVETLKSSYGSFPRRA